MTGTATQKDIKRGIVFDVMDFVEKVEEMIADCPHRIDQATVPKREGRTPEEHEECRLQQEVWEYSISYKRLRDIRYLLRKLGSRELASLINITS